MWTLVNPKCETILAICLRPNVKELGSNGLVLRKAIAPSPYNLRVASSILTVQLTSMMKVERIINIQDCFLPSGIMVRCNREAFPMLLNLSNLNFELDFPFVKIH